MALLISDTTGLYFNYTRSTDNYKGKCYLTIINASSSIVGGNSINNYSYSRRGTPIIKLFTQPFIVGEKITFDGGGYLKLNTFSNISYSFLMSSVGLFGIAYSDNGTLGDDYATLGYSPYENKYICLRPSYMGGSSGQAYTLFSPSFYLNDKFYSFTSQPMCSCLYSFTEEQSNSLFGGGSTTTPVQLTDTFSADTDTTGGGWGEYKKTNDEILLPTIPTSFGGNSFYKIFSPNETQLDDFSAFLWSGDFIDVVKKMMSQPIDSILALHAIPFTPPQTTAEMVTVGGVSSGISMLGVSSQFFSYDFGIITIDEFWGSALDYSPYTKIEIYLPFIGIKQLNVDDVMNSTIELQYNIDLLTGSCVASIKVIRGDLKAVVYNFNGNCATQICLTGIDKTGLVQTLMGLGTTAVGAVTGGAASVATVAMGAMSVATAKTSVEKSGNLSANYGALSVKYPYVIITRPQQSLPEQYKKFNGFPSNICAKLSTLVGYTEIDKILLSNISAQITKGEREEIETLLKQGVIL